jgi:hypothetical protein
MHTAYPLKKVISVETLTNKYCRPGEGCYKFTLICGHTAVSKQSNGTPKHKRCRDCHYGAQK